MKNFDRKKNSAKLVKAPKVTKFGDARDNPDYSGNRSTMPARTRPGKTYPGGRRLRRAQARLAVEQKGTLAARANQGKGGKRSLGDAAFRMPGAMNP